MHAEVAPRKPFPRHRRSSTDSISQLWQKVYRIYEGLHSWYSGDDQQASVEVKTRCTARHECTTGKPEVALAAKVPDIFTHLYADRASILTDALKLLGLSRVQTEACLRLRELTDRFVVVPRRYPIADAGHSLFNETADYGGFRSAVTALMQREFRGDVFSVSWYRHGCFGSLLFERSTFRELYTVLGPHCFRALLLRYYVFERADRDTFVQWTGPPASDVKVSRSDEQVSALRPSTTSSSSTPAGSASSTGQACTTNSSGNVPSSSANSGPKAPAGVCFSRLRQLKAKKETRQVAQKELPVGQNKECAYKFHARSMLYVSDQKKVENRFLLGSPSNLDSARKLADIVFASEDCPSEVRCHVSLLRALRQLLKNHRSCRYRSLLSEHCGCGAPKDKDRAGGVVHYQDTYDGDLLLLTPLSDLVRDHVSVRAVSGFLHAVLRKLIPVELFGTKTNWRKAVHCMASVVKMKKGEIINCGAFAAQLNPNHIPWLQRISGAKGNNRLCWLRIVVSWCTKLAAAIVSIHFYVTDSRKGKRQLLFYRRHIWNALVQVWASGEDILQHADSSNGPPRMEGRGRLVPKNDAGGIRLLVSAPVPKDTESRMRTLKVFLDSISDNGGVDNLYSLWKAFVADWRVRGKPQVFFVKADIENCFHCIDHEVALEVVGRAFDRTEREARIVACTVVKLNRYGRMVKQWRQVFAKDIASMAHVSENPQQPPGCSVVPKAKILVAKTCLLPNAKELKQLLRDYLMKFQVWLYGKRFRLRKGVLQGGVLSADIAEVYITAMQRRHLTSYGNTSGELLVRATDDFLYVTSDQERARRFRNKFCAGFPDFGLFANPSKVQTNLEAEYIEGIRVFASDRADFCGYIFDMTTMEVLRETVTSVPVDCLVGKPESRPGEALKSYLKPWHLPVCPLALDPAINSSDCVVTGLLDMLVSLADRFFFSVNSMQYVDDRYVTEIVLGILDSFLVRVFRWASNEGVKLSLCAEELRFMFLLVFTKKADRKSSIVGKRLLERLNGVRKKLALAGNLASLTTCVDLYFLCL